MKLYSPVFFIFMSIGFCKAQSRLGLMIGGGATYYSGDMNDRVITHEKLLRPYGNLGVLYRLSNRFDVWANYMHGSVAGADSLAVKYVLRNRNLSFKSAIDEAGIYIGYHLLGDNRGKQRKSIPYIFAGVAGYHFKPKAELSGKLIDLQSTGTEGQYIKEGNYPKPYELYQVSVPAGIGVAFFLSKAFTLRLEAARHFLFTDYLDDVSTTYADSASLAAAPNGAVAVLLANRLKEGSFPQKGQDRGNSKINDSFIYIGISLLWTPVKGGQTAPGAKKKKKKKKCDAYH